MKSLLNRVYIKSQSSLRKNSFSHSKSLELNRNSIDIVTSKSKIQSNENKTENSPK
jgi:hypothetical protein